MCRSARIHGRSASGQGTVEAVELVRDDREALSLGLGARTLLLALAVPLVLDEPRGFGPRELWLLAHAGR
jgi:hypothetical protein